MKVQKIRSDKRGGGRERLPICVQEFVNGVDDNLDQPSHSSVRGPGVCLQEVGRGGNRVAKKWLRREQRGRVTRDSFDDIEQSSHFSFCSFAFFQHGRH